MRRLLNRHPGAAAAPSPRAVGRGVALTAALAAVVTAACYNFNVTDPNAPSLQGLINGPTLAGVNAAATGLFASSRGDIQAFIWRVGSMGREGINLSGNNQPDYSEPYYGPLSSSQFGGSDFGTEYTAIRDADVIIDAAPKAPDMSPSQRNGAVGFAQTEKALMFMYVIETRAELGAPVDVDRPANAPPAPFVNEDAVYATIIATLDSAKTNLAAGGGSFSFTTPPGYTIASTPATFMQFASALLAKAYCLRASVVTHDAKSGGSAGAASGYYASALAALDSSFIVSTSPSVSDLANGVYFDFSSGPSDAPNELSDAVTGPTYFADTFNITDAQKQSGGALDQRVLNKIVSITSVPGTTPQILGGIPQIEGWLKFTNYLSNGNANPAAQIPVIRDEELILLKAEAEIGTGDLTDATTDLNTVRTVSGKLPALAGGLGAPALTTELLYNRRYSLLWEQGTRWVDARRFGMLNTIEPGWTGFSGFPPPSIPTRMPIPSAECQARNLGSVCDPLGT